jgi:hypothetical protein
LALPLAALQVGNPFWAKPALEPPLRAAQPPPEASTVRGVQPVALGGPPPAAAAPRPNEVVDPDRIGSCPEAGLAPVVRQGRDLDGLDTWWHADGSITKRTVTEIGGVAVPAIVRLRPAGARMLRTQTGTPADEGGAAIR